jgi:rhodanese-related sulfurtransferase
MKLKTLALTLAFAAGSVAAPLAASACGNEKKTVAELSVQDGAKMAKAGEAIFVDANGKETRTKMGVIPGAILLSHYETYDATKELAATKKEQKLVFYCANEMCGASKVAAEKAMAQGWHNVSVLPVGIKGWKAAGMPTASTAPAASKTGQG